MFAGYIIEFSLKKKKVNLKIGQFHKSPLKYDHSIFKCTALDTLTYRDVHNRPLNYLINREVGLS